MVSKVRDQGVLLVSAIAFVTIVLWLISLMETKGISEKIGFFCLANLIVTFGLTWQGIVWFRRAPHFWSFQLLWVVAHCCLAAAWARSGYWVELCVFALPLECYIYYRVGKRKWDRARQLIS
jgi:hypothetical protein